MVVFWHVEDVDRVPPVIREDGVLQHNLLEQLDELVGQIGGHEGLHRHRDVFRVLQGST